ncbi:rhomboid family intramembrane serine protease [Candidatus Bathyarchaeota archaeon]|nr:rhomboid family intramembrane serine protease [Candidatus Bathyarchaeota archaeon]
MRINWFLMLGCVLASLYAWQVASTPEGQTWAEQNLVFSLNNLLAGRVWTLATALFVHASIQHLLGNLPFLFVFGNTLERMIGRNNHLVVFFLGGFTSFLLPPIFGIYSPDTYMLGASAAIFTLAACVMLMSPLKFSWLFLAPQGLVAIIYFTINAIIVTDPAILGQGLFNPGVAYIAHVIGFTVGIPFGIAWSQKWKRNLLITLGLFGLYIIILLVLATIFGTSLPFGIF